MTLNLMNLLGLLIAAIVSMIIGVIWYGPLFGKEWIKLIGFTEKDIKKYKNQGMWKNYFINFISTLIMAFILYYFILVTPVMSIKDNIIIAFIIWLGFIATAMLGSILWEKKPVKLYLINAGYYLISLIVMAFIISL